MKKLRIAIAISLAAGLAAAAIVLRTTIPEPLPVQSAATIDEFGPHAATEDRIRALEAAVAEERDARQLLEEELLALNEEIDSLRTGPVDTRASIAQAVALNRDPGEIRESPGRRRGGMGADDARRAALVNSGFSTDRAEWIMRRENELRVQAMQARFEAQRSGDMQALMNANVSSEAMLRAELGDSEYERYLEAYGRPTSVGVGAVLESSPGQVAGLQPGDEIMRYDGQRVFSYGNLNEQLLEGDAGERVVVDIVRDGVPMQIVIPRGPIGITATRFSRH